MKYKEAGNGEYCTVDENGNKGQSFNETNSPGRVKEMYDSGLEIEPQFTEAEKLAKVITDQENALKNQESNCIHLLNDSDKNVVVDTPYQTDLQKWYIYRTDLRRIIKSSEIEEIPPKPFS